MESGGTSTYYEVFPGVTIFLNRVSASSCVEKRDRRNAMEVNFCANGRFECWFEPDDLGVLVPGDVAISTFDGEHGACTESRFPLGFYDGLTIYTDCDEATRWMAKNMRCLGIDLNRLRRQIMTDHWYWIGTLARGASMCSGSCLSACSLRGPQLCAAQSSGAVSDAAAAQTAGEGDRIFSGQSGGIGAPYPGSSDLGPLPGATVAEVAALHHISETRLQKDFSNSFTGCRCISM